MDRSSGGRGTMEQSIGGGGGGRGDKEMGKKGGEERKMKFAFMYDS